MTGQDLFAEADRHAWPSQWLDWDTPDGPEACGYCGRLVCACEEPQQWWMEVRA